VHEHVVAAEDPRKLAATEFLAEPVGCVGVAAYVDAWSIAGVGALFLVTLGSARLVSPIDVF